MFRGIQRAWQSFQTAATRHITRQPLSTSPGKVKHTRLTPQDPTILEKTAALIERSNPKNQPGLSYPKTIAITPPSDLPIQQTGRPTREILGSLAESTASQNPAVNRILDTIRAALTRPDQVKYRTIVEHILKPRLETLLLYLQSAENPDTVRTIQAMDLDPLIQILTMHPTLSMKEILREALKKTLDLFELLYYVEHQLDPLASSEELFFIICRVYDDPTLAVSVSPTALNQSFCIHCIESEIRKIWSKASEVNIGLTENRSYPIERKLMNDFILEAHKQATDISQRFGLPKNKVALLGDWGHDADGKQIPFDHLVYSRISSQLTLCNEVSQLAIRILRSLEFINHPNKPAIKACLELIRSLETAKRNLSRGVFLSHTDCQKLSQEIVTELTILSKLPGLMGRTIQQLRHIIQDTQFELSKKFYRQEGALFKDAIKQIAATVDEDPSQFIDRAFSIKTLPELLVQELLRAALCQQGKSPKTIISHSESTDDIAACILINQTAHQLLDHPSVQAKWKSVCQASGLDPRCSHINPPVHPSILVLTETANSILNQSKIVRDAFDRPHIVAYLNRTGGIGFVCSTSDGSADLGAAVRLIHPYNLAIARDLCHEKGVLYNEEDSKIGVGDDDKLRMGSVCFPFAAKTVQGSDIPRSISAAAMFLTWATATPIDHNPFEGLDELQKSRVPAVLAKAIQAHQSVEWGDLVQVATGKWILSSMLRTTEVPLDVRKSRGLSTFSARKNTRIGTPTPLETELSVRRIAKVNQLAVESNGYPPIAWLAAPYSQAELELLSHLRKTQPIIKDLCYLALLTLNLHDPAVFAASKWGYQSAIPGPYERKRLANLRLNSLQIPLTDRDFAELIKSTWAKMELANETALKHLIPIIWPQQIPTHSRAILETLGHTDEIPDFGQLVPRILADMGEHSDDPEDRILAQKLYEQASSPQITYRKELRRTLLFAALAAEQKWKQGLISEAEYKESIESLAETVRTLGNFYGNASVIENGLFERLKLKLTDLNLTGNGK